MSDEATQAAAEAAGETEKTEKAVSKKDPKPEGYVSPVEFAKYYGLVKAGVLTPAQVVKQGYAGDHVPDDFVPLRPQIVYGYINNNKEFREGFVSENTDGHLMVNLRPGLDFLAERDKNRAKAKAEKASKEAAEAAAAAAE